MRSIASTRTRGRRGRGGPTTEKIDEESDRFRFRGDGSAGQPCSVGPSTAGCRHFLQRTGPLGVHHEQRVECREHPGSLAECGRRHRRELLNARWTEEALEGEDAGLVERLQVTNVAGNDPPRKPTSTAQRSRAAARLASSAVTRCGRRNAVERHVEDRRDATRGSRSGRCFEPLPFRPSRLVHVDMGIDEPRKTTASPASTIGPPASISS